MSVISASNLKKSYGAQDVFSGITIDVPQHSRIALVGPNGVGKSTFLRLLVGLEKPDEGSVQRARGLKIGFLPQEATYSQQTRDDLDSTLWDYCLGAFAQLRTQEVELARLEKDMADPSKSESAMARYGRVQEAFELAGGYTYHATARRVLGGMSFTPEEFDRPLKSLSGGERTRALLTRLLLENPDLLILDEPTNHLDIEAIEWLEGWLRDFKGAVLIVSHDRYFLDNTVDRIWDLSPSAIALYRGNYSAFALQRVERMELQHKQYESQQEHLRREEDFIRRNIAGQKTRQAQGRRKRLDRLMRDHAITRPSSRRPVSIDFGKTRRSGDRVVETKNLAVGFPDDDDPLFVAPDLILMRGECAAVIGPNGAGKTTFLKMLLGELAPMQGEVQLGASLKVGYFAQAHEDLDPDLTVLDEILGAGAGLKISEARNLLGRYLFSGDDIEKQVRVLSGGERGRLALAKLTLQGANFLLLDEPTTHLDLASQEVLQEALADFPGTILLISHDRYLIEALATQVWAISPQGRELKVYEGGYAAYAAARRQAAAPPARGRQPRRTESSRPRKSNRGPAALSEAEARIAALESSLKAVTQQLQHAGTDVERVRELGQEYADLESQLQAAMTAWEELLKETEEA